MTTSNANRPTAEDSSPLIENVADSGSVCINPVSVVDNNTESEQNFMIPININKEEVRYDALLNVTANTCKSVEDTLLEIHLYPQRVRATGTPKTKRVRKGTQILTSTPELQIQKDLADPKYGKAHK